MSRMYDIVEFARFYNVYQFNLQHFNNDSDLIIINFKLQTKKNYQSNLSHIKLIFKVINVVKLIQINRLGI